MKKRILLPIFLLVVVFFAVACGKSRDGFQDDQGNYIECYRIFLSESTQTIEGRAIQVATRLKGVWILQTKDGVATIRAGSKYVDAIEEIDCGVLD